MFYLVIFLFALIFSVCNMFSHTKDEMRLSNVFFYTLVFTFIIIGGFRFETGGDWPGYRDLYEGVDTRTIEPFFKGIIYLAKLLGHYQWIFFFCEVIRFATMAIILEKNVDFDKRYKCLFVLLYYVMYFFYYDLVIIRQSTAAAVFIFGVVKENHISFKKYLLYVFLAACFHFSSLFLIFTYYPLFKMKNKTLGVITIGFIFLYFLKIDLLSNLLGLVLKVLPQNYLFSRLYAYTKIAALATVRKITGQSLVYLLIFCMLLFDRFILNKRSNELFFNGASLFVFLYFGFPSLSTISTRLSTFFSIFIIFVLIEIIKIYKKTFFVPIVLITLCFAFNKGVFFEAADKIAYNPYQFYWMHEIFGLNSDGMERLETTNKITDQLENGK